jgi:hypothetical protein
MRTVIRPTTLATGGVVVNWERFWGNRFAALATAKRLSNTRIRDIVRLPRLALAAKVARVSVG